MGRVVRWSSFAYMAALHGRSRGVDLARWCAD
jgi:hypothetical protein